jgi:benzoate transport
MQRDPLKIIDASAMSRVQIAAVFSMIALNALDGFDVLAISFASPGIAAEWGIDRAALGIVLAMELFGMAVGSVLLGGAADRLGRRPLILACQAMMTIGMFMCAQANGVVELCVWRLFTGLGIGGMLAAINAATAEYSNEKSRSFYVSMMAIGYPLGAVAGGLVVAQLLNFYDWRSVFYLGAAANFVLLVACWFLVHETIPFLCQKRPAGALEKVNSTLARMGHAPVAALPDTPEQDQRMSLAALFTPALIRTTILVTLAYFMHVATFYFILKWVPKIVTDMGFAVSSAAGVLVWANVGGALGGAVLGFLARRYPVQALTIGVLVASAAMVVWFGRGQVDLVSLSVVVGVTGFFTNAGIVGLYALFALSFPTRARATGTGFAIGVGRGGAALSPIIAGFLFEAGVGLQGVATFMALGSAIGAVAIFFLRTPRRAVPVTPSEAPAE